MGKIAPPPSFYPPHRITPIDGDITIDIEDQEQIK